MRLNVAIYSVLHFLVDMICAWAMFSNFISANYANLLIYNFCAFALQMPFGALLDLIAINKRSSGAMFAILGVALTVLGAFLHPLLLGIGNALFHVGGGFDVIHGDLKWQRKGRSLGIFVAPGAIGLYIGSLLGNNAGGYAPLFVSVIMILPLVALLIKQMSTKPHSIHPVSLPSHILFILIIACFLVVILRSWIGLAIAFPWKGNVIFAAIAVCGAAAGKVCGGFLGAHFGISRTATISLVLAAFCYLAGNVPLLGILAIFFFNMTMPLTLYLLAEKMPRLAGFSFGLLTFGLFLGFLPVYFQFSLPLSGNFLGAFGSIVTCILLIAAGKVAEHG